MIYCATGNYSQDLIITYNGKESEKEYMCVYIYIYTYIYIYIYIYIYKTESLRNCHNTVNQQYFNFKKVSVSIVHFQTKL